MVSAEHVYAKVHKRVPEVKTLVLGHSFVNPNAHDLFVLVECFEIQIWCTWQLDICTFCPILSRFLFRKSIFILSLIQIYEICEIFGRLLRLVGLVRLDPVMIERGNKAEVNCFQSLSSIHWDIQLFEENFNEFLTIVSFMNFAVNWGFNLNINENLPFEKAKNVVQGWNWDIWLAWAVVRKRRHRFEILLINFSFWEMISSLIQGQIKDIHSWGQFLADDWRHLTALAAMNDS